MLFTYEKLSFSKSHNYSGKISKLHRYATYNIELTYNNGKFGNAVGIVRAESAGKLCGSLPKGSDGLSRRKPAASL